MPILDFLKKREKPKPADSPAVRRVRQNAELLAGKTKPVKKEKVKKEIKKKKIKKPRVIEKKEVPEEVLEKPLKKTVSKKPVPKPKRKISELAFRILKEPHVTEKATFLAERNQYVFKVFPRSNKTEIKKAIEELYGVDVLGVRIIKVPRKRRRLGRISGWRKGYKKAIVKVKQGQKIEILPR